MTRFWIVVVGAAVGIFVLAGCGREAREAPSDPGARERVTTNEVVSGPKPPESTLTLGRRTETGLLGSYCWESLSGATEAFAGCTDVAGIPIPPEEEALTVPRDWVSVFDYGGRRLAWVKARAYRFDREKESLPGPDGGAFLVPSEGRSASETEELRINRLGLGDRVQFQVELPEGQYVVEVSVRVPEGDAAYYFRVVVV
ncbi:MAG: hypothetical protein M3317_06250 [Actinomycetota bacterium]|jgi:hypothetical protein|nr:hypothetical protein [Actinomycetota bacterium]